MLYVYRDGRCNATLSALIANRQHVTSEFNCGNNVNCHDFSFLGFGFATLTSELGSRGVDSIFLTRRRPARPPGALLLHSKHQSPPARTAEPAADCLSHRGRQLIRRQQLARSEAERRQQDRIDFVQQATRAWKTAGASCAMRCRRPGFRLLGSRSLLGQKVRVHLPTNHGSRSCTFSVRILWSCSVGDELFENGGSFMGMVNDA